MLDIPENHIKKDDIEYDESRVSRKKIAFVISESRLANVRAELSEHFRFNIWSATTHHTYVFKHPQKFRKKIKYSEYFPEFSRTFQPLYGLYNLWLLQNPASAGDDKKNAAFMHLPWIHY